LNTNKLPELASCCLLCSVTSGAVQNQGSYRNCADVATRLRAVAFHCLQDEEGFSEPQFGPWAPVFVNFTGDTYECCKL